MSTKTPSMTPKAIYKRELRLRKKRGEYVEPRGKSTTARAIKQRADRKIKAAKRLKAEKAGVTKADKIMEEKRKADLRGEKYKVKPRKPGQPSPKRATTTKDKVARLKKQRLARIGKVKVTRSGGGGSPKKNPIGGKLKRNRNSKPNI